MAQCVFTLGRNLGERLVKAKLHENWVIAKATRATRLANDLALDHSFDETLGPIWQRYSCRATERPASLAVRHI